MTQLSHTHYIIGTTQMVLLDVKPITSAWCQAKIDEFSHFILNLKTRKHSNQRILGHKAAYHGGYYIIRARKRRGLHVDRTILPMIFFVCFVFWRLFSFENDSYLLLMFFFCFWLAKLSMSRIGLLPFRCYMQLFVYSFYYIVTHHRWQSPKNSDKILLQQSHKDQFWEIIRKKNWIVGEIKSITLELDEGGSKTDWWNPVLKLCCKNFLFVFGNHIVLSIESWERDIYIEGEKPKNYGT